MDGVAPVIRKIAEYTVGLVASEIGYIVFLNSNIQKLEREIAILKEKRDTVQHKVSNAKRNAEDIKPVVKNWLSEVDDIVRKSDEIVVNEGRLGGLCSNLVQRHKLSKQATRMTNEALQMKEKGDRFDQVSLPSVLIASSPPKKIDFLEFESRKLLVKQIMDALFDDYVNRIGVYGMGGVGKTMLVKETLIKVRERKLFNVVIELTVGQTPDLNNIQKQLVDILDLLSEQKTKEGRALKLHKRLKKEKSILIVLDDVWGYIDLEVLGIPSVVDHPRCKILFTSRDKHLLTNEMCIDKAFEIKVLEKDEPWNLFKTMVGGTVEHWMEPIANQIVKECAYLPIAITVVAKALRNKPFPIWRDALDQLKNHVAVNIRGMKKDVYSSLKLSYDYLECEEAKLLFLLCSMFPEDADISVEDLQIYAMALGFLNGVGTMAQIRRRITKLVDDLISSSLLLQDESEDNYVKMHDLVRDVAISISSSNEKIHTLSYVNGQRKEWKEENFSGNYTAVYGSIIQDPYSPLIKKLLIPKVQLLTLYTPYFVKYELVESFFEEMKELKSLDLICAEISLFPSSLQSFANIRLLRLLNCELGNIDMIGELQKLEILSFEGSNIIQIPTTISQLTQLKVLNLSSCESLKVIPPNILSKLTKLEELYLGSFDGWEREEWYKGRKNASLSELRYLPHIDVLHIKIQDENIIPKQLFSRELDLNKFRITIGRIPYRYEAKFDEIPKVLYLNMESKSCLDDWIKTLLKKSEGLCLVGSIGTMCLHLKLDVNDYSPLKHLQLVNNQDFQHFIHKKNKPLQIFLSNLEYLEMSNVKNLESIIHGYDGDSHFNKLRIVTIESCNELRTLFLNCKLDDILNLEEINIERCEKMETIVVIDNEQANNQIEFTSLKSFCLKRSPQLLKFCSKTEKFGQLSLDDSETTTIYGGYFFNEQVSLPNLEKLKIGGAVDLKMIWQNILVLNSFSKLKEVEIWSCDSLEKVFPANIMNILTCLNTLTVEDCDLLRGIFEVQESNTAETSAFIQNLRCLRLSYLPNLEYVWSKDPSELLIFENIKEFSINECPKLERTYPVKVLDQLQSLEINFSELKEVLDKEKSAHVFEAMQLPTSKATKTQMEDSSRMFSNLKRLKLFGSFDLCKSTQLPMEVVQILHNLEEFEVRRAFIEEIFPTERLINGQISINVEEYQNVTSMALHGLDLSELPNLRHIWKNSHNNILSLEELSWLSVHRCSQLNTLLPSSMSFRNLFDLDVDECHRLTHLMDASVARALVQLQLLSITSCKMMTTIIVGDEEAGNDEIVFKNLENCSLSHLSKLANFYSGKCIIKFPCLNEIEVEDCPEMKVFSMGIVSTPALPAKSISFVGNFICGQILKVNSEEILVKDINVIFRQLWEENSDAVYIQRLFAEENLEENQSDLGSSDPCH